MAVLIIDTTEFARITETVAALPVETGTGTETGAAWRRGLAAGLRVALAQERPEPRHARPRGHLRLIEGGRR